MSSIANEAVGLISKGSIGVITGIISTIVSKLPVVLDKLGTITVLGVEGVTTGAVGVLSVFIRILVLPYEIIVLPSGLKSI